MDNDVADFLEEDFSPDVMLLHDLHIYTPQKKSADYF